MTEVVVTTTAIIHAELQSNHHHQQTNTQLFTGRMPFLSPNQQCQSTEGKTVPQVPVHLFSISKTVTFICIVLSYELYLDKMLMLWKRENKYMTVC